GADATIHKAHARPGTYVVTLKEIDAAAWEAREAQAGEAVGLGALVWGFADGTPARVRIFREHEEADGEVIETLDAKVENNRIHLEHTFDETHVRSAWEQSVALVAELSVESGKYWAKTVRPLQITLKAVHASWTNQLVYGPDVAELVVRAHGYKDGTKV